MVLRKRKITKTAGVVLEIPVLDYLRQLGERDERDRSYCINRIVREHAQREGCPLPSAHERPADDPPSRPEEP